MASDISNNLSANAIPIPGSHKDTDDDESSTSIFGKSPRFSPSSTRNVLSIDGAGVPLQSSWTFWFDRYERGCTAAQYEANLKLIFKVNTIEGFWSVFNNIPKVYEIGLGSYHLMRGDRRPLWEDPGNVAGGYWKMRCPKYHTQKMWNEMLLSVIGEQFEDALVDGDEIVGLSVSIRDRDDVLQLWNENAGLAPMSKVTDQIKQLTPDLDHKCLFYKAHQAHSAFEGLEQVFPKKMSTT